MSRIGVKDVSKKTEEHKTGAKAKQYKGILLPLSNLSIQCFRCSEGNGGGCGGKKDETADRLGEEVDSRTVQGAHVLLLYYLMSKRFN